MACHGLFSPLDISGDLVSRNARACSNQAYCEAVKNRKHVYQRESLDDSRPLPAIVLGKCCCWWLFVLAVCTMDGRYCHRFYSECEDIPDRACQTQNPLSCLILILLGCGLANKQRGDGKK